MNKIVTATKMLQLQLWSSIRIQMKSTIQKNEPTVHSHETFIDPNIIWLRVKKCIVKPFVLTCINLVYVNLINRLGL